MLRNSPSSFHDHLCPMHAHKANRINSAKRNLWQTGRKAVFSLLVILASILLSMAGIFTASEKRVETGYASLAISEDPLQASCEINPNVVGWLAVDNTQINYPVVAERESDPKGFYLTHDLWRNYSIMGTPYIDSRTTATSRHVLAYGHRGGTGMFTDLCETNKQWSFNQVGNLHWEPISTSRNTTYQPLCAMSVDMNYTKIQKFDFASNEELRSWLKTVVADSQAKSVDANELIDGATHVYTTVTCSSLRPHQRMRTLTVFVAS